MLVFDAVLVSDVVFYNDNEERLVAAGTRVLVTKTQVRRLVMWEALLADDAGLPLPMWARGSVSPVVELLSDESRSVPRMA
jgi:hypothetical protein